MPASAASGADSAAQMRRVSPWRRAPSATAIVPATGRTRPSSESSPTQPCSSSRSGESWCEPGEERERDRQVEAGSLLAKRRRGEVDRDPVAARPRQHRVDDAAVHAVLGLLAGAVGEPDDRERGQLGRDEVRLDLHAARLEADDGGGEGSREHTTDGTGEPRTTLSREVGRKCAGYSRARHSAGVIRNVHKSLRASRRCRWECRPERSCFRRIVRARCRQSSRPVVDAAGREKFETTPIAAAARSTPASRCVERDRRPLRRRLMKQPREADERQEVVPRPISARARHERRRDGAQDGEDARPGAGGGVARSFGAARSDSTTAAISDCADGNASERCDVRTPTPSGPTHGEGKRPSVIARLLEHLDRPRSRPCRDGRC